MEEKKDRGRNAERIFDRYYGRCREIFWYLICGAGTTVVNLTVYGGCAYVLRTETAVSTGLAWLCAVAFAYLTNRVLVFQSKNRGAVFLLREMAAFVGARMVSGILDMLLMVMLVDVLGLPQMWMKLPVNILVTILNFLFSKCLVFRRREAGIQACEEGMAKRGGCSHAAETV